MIPSFRAYARGANFGEELKFVQYMRLSRNIYDNVQTLGTDCLQQSTGNESGHNQMLSSLVNHEGYNGWRMTGDGAVSQYFGDSANSNL